MRFNPPPNWPQPPAGWTSPPDWQPDVANLPPLPDGWVLWLPDDLVEPRPGLGSIAPVATASSLPVAPPVPVREADPTAYARSDPSALADALQLRRTATRTFWGGMAALVGTAVTAVVASGDRGGIIWTGGVIFGAGLLLRSGTAYRSARRAGAPRYAARGWLGATTGVAVLLVAGGAAIASYVSPGSVMPHVATGVGSCWVEDHGEYLKPVDCSDAHRFTAVEQVETAEACPLEAAWYVEADDTGYLCLREDA